MKENPRLFSNDLSTDERILLLLYRMCDERGKSNVRNYCEFEAEQSKIIPFPGSRVSGK